jgi:hypothetical protein
MKPFYISRCHIVLYSFNSIIKFADGMTVVGLITNNDEIAYMEEVGTIAVWCQVNNLSLNVSKTKELIVDFRRNQAGPPPSSSTGPPWRRSITSNSSACTSQRS